MANPTRIRRHLQLLPETTDWESRVRGLRVLTGNTPLLAIDCEVATQASRSPHWAVRLGTG